MKILLHFMRMTEFVPFSYLPVSKADIYSLKYRIEAAEL